MMKYTNLFSSILRPAVISVLLGFVSGMIGASLVTSSLSDYETELEQQTRPLTTTNVSPQMMTVSSDSLARMREISSRRVGSVFAKSSKRAFGYSKEDALATGIILTSDGWMALSSSVTGFSKEQLVVSVDRDVFDVTGVMVDPATSITFLKMSATNLSVVSFGNAFDVETGESVFMVDAASSFQLTHIAKHLWPEGEIVSSDVPGRRLMLASSSFHQGDLIFHPSGSFIGFGVKKELNTVLLPLEDVLPSLASLLESKKITHVSLGVHYVDLAHTIDIPQKFSRGYTVGAYLTGRPFVRKGSPAALAGFNEGDIILSLNGQSIDENHGLDERLLQRKIGETVLIAFDRLGEKKTVQVVLGELGK